MTSRKTPVPARPKPTGAAAISLAAALTVVLAVAGIWWGTHLSSPSGQEGPSAGALPSNTRMGAVELFTDELAPMRWFYVDAVGLEVLSESSDTLVLGGDGEELLRIVRKDGLAADSPTGAGLYHSAILYPNVTSLADTLLRVATAAPQSYSGSADHAVSLAFYFSDPDGNGLELYTDTPEDSWVWKDGLVSMGSAPLDPNAFISQYAGASPAQALPAMGHVHLRVGDLNLARAFYADTLGFAVTAESDGALFYAAGGYHHHVATNTWGSAGAVQRTPSQGLGSLAVHLGDVQVLEAVAMRLTNAGLDFVQDSLGITVDDPWGNTVRLLA